MWFINKHRLTKDQQIAVFEHVLRSNTDIDYRLGLCFVTSRSIRTLYADEWAAADNIVDLMPSLSFRSAKRMAKKYEFELPQKHLYGYWWLRKDTTSRILCIKSLLNELQGCIER